MTPDHPPSPPALPDADFVLAAAHALSRPQAPDGVLRTFLALLRGALPARGAVLEWHLPSGWVALAGWGPEGDWAATAPGSPPPPGALALPAAMRQALLAEPQPGQGQVAGLHADLGLALRDQASGPPVGLLLLQGLPAPLLPGDARIQAVGLVGQQLLVALRAAWSVQALQAELARQRDALAAEQRERARAESAAAGALQRKTDFLAQMSQEIRTPMSAILGMSHLALRSGLNPQQHDYLRKVESSAESLLGLVNDMLDYSRIEAGRLEIEQAQFRLSEVLDDLSSVVSQKAEEKKIELLFALPAGLPEELVGDPVRLGQVLVNLVGNAIKFTEKGQVVLRVQPVQVGPDGARLRFEVADSGEGLTPEQHARLFMPLPLAEPGPARGHEGPGLGLIISRHLVRLMGGEIQARSGPGGRGSTFEFTAGFGLPVEVETPSPAATLPAGTRLLVVDDNDASRQILVDLGRQLGCEVEAVRDGWDALRAITLAHSAHRPFHLALLDWRMPGMDGVACARQMARSHPDTALLMSTSGGHEALTQALKAQSVGVRGILPKPVTLRQLHEAAASALATARAGALPPPRPTPVPLPAHLRGARLLLVEDNPINQEMALEVLQQAGLAVTVVDNGLKALAVLEQERFDTVLMDCQMPVMDGYEATREMRRKPRWARLPVIALTAAASPADREKALASGMNDLVAKPFLAEALIQAIGRWVQPTAAGQVSPPATARVAPGDPLLGLYGIDSQSALTAMGGNVNLYRRLLLKFHAANHDFGARFRSARAAGDHDGARRLAHDLRGISGSLGARELHRTAALLENACAAAQADDNLEAPLAELLQELEPVMSSLQSLDPA